MRLRLLAILAALALGLAACGGGEGDEDQIRSVVETFYGNEDGVCGTISDKLLEEQFESREDCEEAAAGSEPQDDYEIERVSVDGDEGEVDVAVDGQTGTLLVTQEDGEWKVDGIKQQAPPGDGETTTPPGE